MTEHGQRWAIVLAAGDGNRLQSITMDAAGASVPKQYCALRGRESLLALALARARRVAAAQRIVPVVAEQHRRWWEIELAALAPGQIAVQPRNRGTAPGLLLPLLSVLQRDPRALVVVLPSDHFVANETGFAVAIERAFRAAAAAPARIVLLGIQPQRAETGLGWMLPASGWGSFEDPPPVVSFVEKPPRGKVRRLMAEGALVNTFVLVGLGTAFLDLFRERGDLLEAFAAALAPGAGERALDDLYRRLPVLDLSRDVLQGSERRLLALRVPPCGWADLGTPDRVRDCLRRHPAPRHPRDVGCAAVELARTCSERMGPSRRRPRASSARMAARQPGLQ